MNFEEALQSQNMMIKVGSMNNPTGQLWDYKGKSEIVQIFISHCSVRERVYSIQFLYVENGELVMSQKHGDSYGNMFNVVKLDYPSEFITRISGYNVRGGMRSLTIGTNEGTYGPFGGPAMQQNFNIQMGDQDNAFGGFHGSIVQFRTNRTSRTRIQSIGVYVKPISSLSNLNSA